MTEAAEGGSGHPAESYGLSTRPRVQSERDKQKRDTNDPAHKVRIGPASPAQT